MTFHFVQNGYRLLSSKAGLAELGIPVERQIYPNLPDGALPDHIDLLAKDIFKHALRRGISRFITFGSDGFDGHPDHIAVHLAALEAANLLRQHGRAIGILAVNGAGEGNMVVPVDPDVKKRAVKHHSDQMTVVHNSAGVPILAPRNVYRRYDNIFGQEETYDLI